MPPVSGTSENHMNLQLVCPKGCSRPVLRFAHGGSIAFSGSNARGFAEQKRASRIPLPGGTREDFDAMVGLTQLRATPPALELFDDLHGVGGLFVADQWAILVGLQDQVSIAANVLQRWPHESRRIYAQANCGRQPTPKQLFDVTLEAAVHRCMAH